MTDRLVLVMAERVGSVVNHPFEYQTVDIPTRRGRPQIDATCNLMGQEGWRPLAIILPTPPYPTYSILFERSVGRGDLE